MGEPHMYVVQKWSHTFMNWLGLMCHQPLNRRHHQTYSLLTREPIFPIEAYDISMVENYMFELNHKIGWHLAGGLFKSSNAV